MTAAEAGDVVQVAIIGGGCAGLAAAFELSRPEHGGRFEVTVYQQGWRLGGKGASGRGIHGRIEEHGLHLWMGYYENAFRLIRECYAELQRPADAPLATWEQAFEPLHDIGTVEREGGDWSAWMAQFPPNHELPGEPDPPDLYGAQAYVDRLLLLAATLVRSASESRRSTPTDVGVLAVSAAVAASIQAIEAARLVVGRGVSAPSLTLIRALDAARRVLDEMFGPLLDRDAVIRRTWELAEIALANARGIIADGLLTDPRGLDAINHVDYRDWLTRHGAGRTAARSAVVRALYDLCFAYEDGDLERPRFAAGQALRCALRAFFTYRGAVFWRMNAGMGDAVFAPLYEVLRNRGVRFSFFSRLLNVNIGERGETRWVKGLTFERQARVAHGLPYNPLVNVRGLPSWPASPDVSQLADEECSGAFPLDFESPDGVGGPPVTLSVGEDFDLVVLAVGFGEVARVCREIIAVDERWRRMVTGVKTVATQALQLWLEAPVSALGWRGRTGAVSGLRATFDTWADMSHLIPAENWEPPPGAIAYFCSPLAEPDAAGGPGRARQAVRRNATQFLEEEIEPLWPASVAGGGFRWELLAARPTGGPAEPGGPDRIDGQYYAANVHPTDRYVLSLPGTLDCRISPLDGTYINLTVAGDWTDCGFNCGCVEAAVISGRLAAHALSGLPELEAITGFDHP